MNISFVKMEGLGNDFVIMDDRNGEIRQRISCADLALKLCDRHFGIGADGIILAGESSDHDVEFIIYNCDGSQAQMCGNGMRCFAKHLYETKVIQKTQMRVATQAGTIVPKILADDNGRVVAVQVDMGKPVLRPADIPFVLEGGHDTALEQDLDLGDGRQVQITAVSMGNPHAVLFVKDLSQVDAKALGRKIETHPRFPEKTNVEFIEVMGKEELRMRVWERGAGVTLACGTGACASVVAAILTGRIHDHARVHLDGGDLDISWDKETGHVYKTGPARLVFEGVVAI